MSTVPGTTHSVTTSQPMANTTAHPYGENTDMERKTAANTNAAGTANSRFTHGPLANIPSHEAGTMHPAFGGEFQPGLWKGVEHRKFANPAPLGLCSFALTTFVLSLINLNTHGITQPNIVIAIAFAYGGFIQVLAGMWEMAVGNTFGATAFSSYGAFWLAFGLILTPSLGIVDNLAHADQGHNTMFHHSFSLFLWGWFIFTTLLFILTLRSTLAFFLLFLTLDIAFFFLALGYGNEVGGKPHPGLIKAGGAFGLVAAFLAWYNAFAGIADSSNSFFVIPVLHFPWSEAGRKHHQKTQHIA